MLSFFGVVHPQLYHSRDFIHKMLKVSSISSSTQTAQTLKRDYFEVAIQKGDIYTHEKSQNTLFFVGKIYNLASIKDQLKRRGYPSENFSSSQCLYLLYEHLSEDFIHEVDGDFCLGLILRGQKRLCLYTDKMGKYKIYWSYLKGYLVFSSQIKAMLRTGLVPQEISKSGIASYLSMGLFPQDLSPIEGVHKLLPGHYLTWEQGRGVEVKSYWSYSEMYFDNNALEVPEKELPDALEAHLKRAIDLRKPENEQMLMVGGGLGSATLAALMKASTHPHLAFMHAQQPDSSNYKAIINLANTLSLPQYPIAFEPSHLFDNLLSMVWALDEPLADSHTLFTWEFCKQLSKQSSSFFSSMGANELLGLCSRYQHLSPSQPPFYQAFMHKLANSLTQLIKGFSIQKSFQLLKAFKNLEKRPNAIFEEGLFSDKERKKLSRETYLYFSPDSFLKTFSLLKNFPSPVHAFLYYDTKTQLCDRFLIQYQNFSNHYNLDWHTPFLDPQLMRFIASIPSFYKSDRLDFPSPLIAILEKYGMNQAFTHRSRPAGKNFFDLLVSKPYIQNILQPLSHGVLVESGLLSSYYLNKYVLKPPITHLSFNRVFGILCLEVWYRLFVVNNLDAPPPNEHLLDFLHE